MGAKYYLQYVFVQIDQDYQELFVQRNEQSVMMVIIYNEELKEGSVKGSAEIITKILWFIPSRTTHK